MKSHSARWDAAVTQAHRIAVEVTVLYNRTRVADVAPLAVVSGTVTADRNAAQRSRLDATFAEPLLVPAAAGPLSPYGYELAVQRGIAYADGTSELMALGVFPIQTTNVDGVTLVSQVTAADRSQLVKDARLEDDYQIAAGTNFADAIQTLIAAGVDGLTYRFATTTFVTPLLTFAVEADRWDAAQGMAESCGMELYFDGVGDLYLLPVATSPAAAATISEGDSGVLISASLSADRAAAYNRVIATGTNASAVTIARGVWTDTAPNSPSQYSGGFGHKPRFFASPFLLTDAQAQSAADAMGARVAGVARSLNFAAVPNPALEVGDCIEVRRGALGVDELHTLDTLSIGLTAEGAMAGQSRAVVA